MIIKARYAQSHHKYLPLLTYRQNLDKKKSARKRKLDNPESIQANPKTAKLMDLLGGSVQPKLEVSTQPHGASTQFHALLVQSKPEASAKPEAVSISTSTNGGGVRKKLQEYSNIAELLNELLLEAYIPAFQQEEINPTDLPYLLEEDLRKLFNNKIEPCRQILEFRSQFDH